MSEVFSILLHNRQRYKQGKEGLWFSLPTTTEKLQAALREIGISADNPQDFFLYGYRSPQERPVKLPCDLVLSADVEELNFLAARLEKLDAAELAELNAALTSPQSDFHSIGQIIDYPDNVDYFVHLPDVTGTGQLGDYYLNRSGMVDMPEEWKAGIFLPRFGLHIANTEHGVFTDYGYLVKSGDEWQRVHEGQPVPEEYRVMAYPAPEILRDEAPARTVQPEVAPTAEAAAPPPVVPIILNSQNSADRMKEITDRLETGIQELFESERYTAYLTSMAKFHSYSFNNTLLIAMQGGQLVAGYNKWRDDFHRNVKRGEKGIKILAPAPYKVKKEMPKLDEQGQPVMDKDGNHLTPKAKTVKVQTECVNRTLVQYNPEIVKATKEAALPALLQQEAKDNEIAAQKGLKPYTLLNVEFNEGADEKTGGYIGWYYVTLAVDGKICTHLETGLNHDIASGKVSDTPTRADYYPAGALKEADVDYVLNNVGFSSASTLYTVPLRDDVRERAEKTLAERSAAAPEQGDIFAIYQIKGGPETRDYRFEAYESLQEAGLAVDRQNYDLVYTAPLDGKTTLEDIYRTFNLDRPADFTGHSLSVSDIVVLTRSGKEEAHYCDSFGFTPVPEFFLQREKQLTPRELLTGERIQTPRGSFLVTDMSRGQLEAAAYGFHHQSEDGKYLIMGNGTDAFAIPAQQESPIKAAEMTTEQNYNMIDGVLNNAPTMSELEAKVKAGEQISLFDVAEAAKAEAQKPKQPQSPAQKQKKPSIRAQLKAAKEEQQKKPPQREKAQELEV
ncbi:MULTISPECIES: YodL domain-containing protein [unclassified Clostridium]|uniref:YodL domain-containing protein n=1 Tax=unclassified Clostridium TaxID=2614128 RepID=UPI001FA96DC8|nr:MULTISPECIES: YodL domain-containing protein [unclassified Clostridium]